MGEREGGKKEGEGEGTWMRGRGEGNMEFKNPVIEFHS